MKTHGASFDPKHIDVKSAKFSVDDPTELSRNAELESRK